MRRAEVRTETKSFNRLTAVCQLVRRYCARDGALLWTRYQVTQQEHKNLISTVVKFDIIALTYIWLSFFWECHVARLQREVPATSVLSALLCCKWQHSTPTGWLASPMRWTSHRLATPSLNWSQPSGLWHFEHRPRSDLMACSCNGLFSYMMMMMMMCFSVTLRLHI